jgi:hypothetical protein
MYISSPIDLMPPRSSKPHHLSTRTFQQIVVHSYSLCSILKPFYHEKQSASQASNEDDICSFRLHAVGPRQSFLISVAFVSMAHYPGINGSNISKKKNLHRLRPPPFFFDAAFLGLAVAVAVAAVSAGAMVLSSMGEGSSY